MQIKNKITHTIKNYIFAIIYWYLLYFFFKKTNNRPLEEFQSAARGNPIVAFTFIKAD
jgi:hypothetical protein